MFRKAELIEILAAFPAVRTTIVGDLIADVYITARTERISREAPVLVLRHQGEELMPGGAGNVIKNMVRLGARPKVVGWVGDDAPGRALLRIFREWSLDVSDLVCEVAHATPTKTRILAGDVHVMPHQVLRLDRGGEQTLSADARAALCDAVRRELAAAGRSVVFSDYGAQTIDPTIVSAIRERPGGGARVLVDSRFALASFAGVDVVLPNEPEARALLGHPLLEAELPVVAAELYDRIGVETVLLTLGNKGLALFCGGRMSLRLPASGSSEVVDTTGAGDSVTAVVTIALEAGASPEQAAFLANIAAGITVSRPRNECASLADLRLAVDALES